MDMRVLSIDYDGCYDVCERGWKGSHEYPSLARGSDTIGTIVYTSML